MWIRTNDTVVVITGEDRGTRGKVLRIVKNKTGDGNGRLVVEGVNRVYRHVRRSQRNPQGGRLSVEMPVPQCNVALKPPFFQGGSVPLKMLEMEKRELT